MKKIFLLGTNGSIGKQCLDVIDEQNIYEIIGLSISYNDIENHSIINKYQPKIIIVRTIKQYYHYKSIYPQKLIIYNIKNINSAYRLLSKDTLVINGLSGIAGVLPMLKAIKHGLNVAFANKESYVIYGSKINTLLKKHNVDLIPIDSELSSLYQLSAYIKKHYPKQTIIKYGITASGGALRDKSEEELKTISSLEIFNHPTWKMGKKVTLDSATLLNKAFEVIETIEYFNISYKDICVKIERSSNIHAFIETNKETFYFIDTPDMKKHIRYALNYDTLENFMCIVTKTNLKLLEINYDQYPIYSLAVGLYLTNKRAMKSLVKYSEKLCYLLINGKIVYCQLVNDLCKFIKGRCK